VFALFVLNLVCLATAPPASAQVEIGDEVRCEKSGDGMVRGELLAMTDTSVSVQVKHASFLRGWSSASVETWSGNDLMTLQCLKEKRSFTVLGILVGLVAGVAFGSADDEIVPVGQIVGGGLGAMLGGAAGTALSYEKWVPVDLPERAGAERQ